MRLVPEIPERPTYSGEIFADNGATLGRIEMGHTGFYVFKPMAYTNGFGAKHAQFITDSLKKADALLR